MAANVNTLIARLHELEEENARLKSLLAKHGIPYKAERQDGATIASQPSEANRLSLQEKVRLFQCLFKGREDVFAKRWYSNSTGHPAINLYASVNGTGTIVTSGNISAQNVRIGSLYH